MKIFIQILSLVFLSAAGLFACAGVYFFTRSGAAAGFGGIPALVIAIILGAAGFGMRKAAGIDSKADAPMLTPAQRSKNTSRLALILALIVFFVLMGLWGVFF